MKHNGPYISTQSGIRSNVIFRSMIFSHLSRPREQRPMPIMGYDPPNKRALSIRYCHSPYARAIIIVVRHLSRCRERPKIRSTLLIGITRCVALWTLPQYTFLGTILRTLPACIRTVNSTCDLGNESSQDTSSRGRAVGRSRFSS